MATQLAATFTELKKAFRSGDLPRCGSLLTQLKVLELRPAIRKELPAHQRPTGALDRTRAERPAAPRSVYEHQRPHNRA